VQPCGLGLWSGRAALRVGVVVRKQGALTARVGAGIRVGVQRQKVDELKARFWGQD